jgi:hypothetical protein
MVANVVLLLLVAWLACTAAMSIHSAMEDSESAPSLPRERTTGAPAPTQPFTSVAHDSAD